MNAVLASNTFSSDEIKNTENEAKETRKGDTTQEKLWNTDRNDIFLSMINSTVLILQTIFSYEISHA